MPDPTRRPGRRAGTSAGLPLHVVGAVLLVVLGVAVVGLGVSGQLTLYVHPRYLLLSVVMAVAAAALGTLALVLPAHEEDGPVAAEHGHPQDRVVPEHRTPRPVSRWRSTSRLVPLLQVLLIALVVSSVLVLPPSTLSTSLRSARGLSPATGPGLESSADQLVGADTTTFTVRDWAVLLQQGGPDAVVGRPVDVTGYVLDRGQDDVFYVARLVISCCAVDAQPIGVAVRSPGWRTRLRTDGWVRVRGTFVDPGATSQDIPPAVVEPTSLGAVQEPKDPYVF